MLRLIKFLKPYTLFILLTILLLFVVADTNLALPDYMSNIVNVGIQQGGIQKAVPQAIRQSEMNRLTIFMSASDKIHVLNDYILVDKTSPDYATYVKDYPDLANEPVYILKSIDSTEINAINPVMGKAFLIVGGIQQVMVDPSKASSLGLNAGFDLSKLPAGTDLFCVNGETSSCSARTHYHCHQPEVCYHG